MKLGIFQIGVALARAVAMPVMGTETTGRDNCQSHTLVSVADLDAGVPKPIGGHRTNIRGSE